MRCVVSPSVHVCSCSHSYAACRDDFRMKNVGLHVKDVDAVKQLNRESYKREVNHPKQLSAAISTLHACAKCVFVFVCTNTTDYLNK